ncbi:MAG: ATP-dependent Clp protease ATP-binding subunit [Roseburia sp.]|nr:ATP-dependent Clp protease ATP-binding subunit [Roseburia sp.]
MAANIAWTEKDREVQTGHLLCALAVVDGTAKEILKNNNIREEDMRQIYERCFEEMKKNKKNHASEMPFTPVLQKILQDAETLARYQKQEVGTEHLLMALAKQRETTAGEIIAGMQGNPKKIYMDAAEMAQMDSEFAKTDFMSAKEKEERGRSLTPCLDKFSRDLVQEALDGKLDPVFNRENEIDSVMEILGRRTKNNPCILGEPGVGKTAIVEGLAGRIANNAVPASLKNIRVLSLDVSGMVAGTKYRGQFEERIKRCLRETIDAGNIILFIDELHMIIGAGGAEGAMDAANILKPALSRGEIQIIGATTREEYRKRVEKDSALDRRFQQVIVEEPSIVQAVSILKGLRSHYESYHHIEISDEALEAAVKLSDRYINDRFLPDKAIDLIDEAASRLNMSSMREYEEALQDKKEALENVQEEKENAVAAGDMDYAVELHKEEEKLSLELRQAQAKWEKKQKKQRKIMGESHVAEVVSRQTKIPVSRLEKDETRRLQKLEKILHERVVGQDEAVEAVSRAVRRGRVGLKDPNRPIGSFLFLGPTGVGKTELSKTLAEAVFGSEKNMIRVDMSEYMEKQSVSKMIGSPPGYVGFEEGGQLSEKVRRNPYSVLLFDEIEKAHPDVFNMLLQILEDGRLTDSQGRQVDFKNTIIIMTSNAGANRIVSPKTLGFLQQEDAAADYRRMREGVMEEVKHIFKPEFINRIDEILVFHMLSKEDIHKIAANMLTGFKKRVKKQMDIRLQYGKAVVDHVADKGFDKDYGARPLRRTIQKEIEDQLAEKIVSGEVHIGDDVRVSIKKDAVCVQKIIKKG